MHTAAAILTVSFLTLALTVPTSAQTGTQTGTQTQRQAWAPPSSAVESKQIVGMKVRSDQGRDIGEIDQLIVNPSDGKITHVVVGRGGLLGVGEQKVVVEWSDLRFQPDPENRNRWVATTEQSKIDSAPRYEARRDTAPAASPATTPGSQPRPERKP